MFKFEKKKHRAVKKHISSNEKAGITARSMYLFAGGNASKYSRLFLPNSYSFPGGDAREPFFGLQRTVPTQIFYFRFSQPRPPQSFARRRTGGLAKAGENTIE